MRRSRKQLARSDKGIAQVEWLATAVLAGFMTLIDMDRTFYVPASTNQKLQLYFWWWVFVGANAGLAVGLYLLVEGVAPFKGMDPVVRALTVGGAYLAIVRAKFTTFKYAGKDIPFGFEAFYEGAKDLAYRRINRIAKVARRDETIALATKTPLPDLASQAKISINTDSLLSAEDKRALQQWVLKVLNDTNASDFDKRADLANFILSGQRSAD